AYGLLWLCLEQNASDHMRYRAHVIEQRTSSIVLRDIEREGTLIKPFAAPNHSLPVFSQPTAQSLPTGSTDNAASRRSPPGEAFERRIGCQHLSMMTTAAPIPKKILRGD
ncbi:MAG: hypothetical protein WCF57_02265, partial [Pyrinomonadaceae bacterium]